MNGGFRRIGLFGVDFGKAEGQEFSMSFFRALN